VSRHAHRELQLAVRLPEPEALARAKELLGRVDRGEQVPAWEVMRAHGTVLLQERFGARPADVARIHALRVGDVALVTQPCELYCQFGLDIKRRSPTPLVGVCGITDGYAGYCPTLAAVAGGGYSAEPMYWSRLSPEAGHHIVDTACALLHGLWPRGR